MNCAGCGVELQAHELAVYEALRRQALATGAGDPVVKAVCEACADLPCCITCDRPITKRWPHYACGKTCSATPGRAATCCDATCLRLHMMKHHREELVGS